MSIRIFVAMPFEPEFAPVWEKALNSLNVPGQESIVSRVDIRRLPNAITDDITDMIRTSDIVIADVTGSNPNVLYEAGLAHAWLGKMRVIMICKGSLSELPFDIRDIRTLSYSTHPDGIVNLKTQIELSIVEVIKKAGKAPGLWSKTVEYCDHRKLSLDGDCEVYAKRTIRILKKLRALDDSWDKGTASTFKVRPEVNIEEAINLPDGCIVTVDYEPLRANKCIWRLIFSPPIKERGREITVGYRYTIPDAWRPYREDLLASWSQREVAGSAAYFVGKSAMSRSIPSYYRLFAFRVDFPRCYEIQAPELIITSGGERRRSDELELSKNGAFKVNKRNEITSIELICKTSVAGKYSFAWVPPSRAENTNNVDT